ncbi:MULTISPECIES: hypothetical protein [unclassified Yoonia]|uniref:hypothetical protein n=1 Tax=unclassified Yoonia TaxID=2629118 RepID=UPI002B000772|nr:MULTISPECIES: hypothetical protein [unclassified Yoonia]
MAPEPAIVQAIPDRPETVGFATKLQALAAKKAAFIGPARIISSTETPAPLAAILAEIDTCVLDRSLTFDIDGVILRMAVAGRRLRGLLAGSDDATALIGLVLTPHDKALLRSVGDLLAGLCKDARQITVTSRAAEPFGTPSERGVSATVLSALWQQQGAVTAHSPMQRFLAANDAVLTAYVQAAGGAIRATKGDATALEVIWHDQLGPFRDRRQALVPQDNTPLLIGLEAGDAITAIAILADEVSIFTCAAADLNAILTSWRTLTA